MFIILLWLSAITFKSIPYLLYLKVTLVYLELSFLNCNRYCRLHIELTLVYLDIITNDLEIKVSNIELTLVYLNPWWGTLFPWWS